MGTITGTTLANNAAGLMHDADKVRWTDADWLQWLNDGQREVLVLKPEANIINQSMLLAPSTTRQTLPTGGVQFLEVTRNMGADGSTPGGAVRVVSREALDAAVPNWHSDAATGLISNYMFDPRDPLHFYVYPQAPASDWYLEVTYSAIPAEMSALTETIGLEDIYANALVSYMLYRAYQRDAEYAQNAQLALMSYQSFVAAITGKTETELTRNPNLSTAEPTLAPQGVAGKPN
jgi:hypothetical protein